MSHRKSKEQVKRETQRGPNNQGTKINGNYKERENSIQFHQNQEVIQDGIPQQLQELMENLLRHQNNQTDSLTRQQLEQLVNQIVQEQINLDIIQRRGQIMITNYQQELDDLEKISLVKKSGDNRKQNGPSYQNKNTFETKITEIQQKINKINTEIAQKSQQNQKSHQLLHYKQELEDFEKLQKKFKDEVSLKQAQLNIEKQKVVIDHGKLNNLKAEHAEKEQTLISLVKHYEQIQQRINMLKKEKKQLVKDNQKNKKQPGKYPVRQEISIYERENQLLQKQLQREKLKLRQYQVVKENSVSQQIYGNKKKQLEKLKSQEIQLKGKLNQNKKLKEQKQMLEETLQSMKQIDEQIINEKLGKIKKCQQQIEGYQKQKNRFQQLIENNYTLLADYAQKVPQHYNNEKKSQIQNTDNINDQKQSQKIQFNQKNEQLDLQITDRKKKKQDKRKGNKRNKMNFQKNFTAQEQNEKQINQKQDSGWVSSFKEDIKTSFNDWMINLQINRQNLPRIAIILIIMAAIFLCLVSI